MSKAVITVEGLGKQYNIGALHRKLQHDTLRDKIASGFKSARRHFAHRTKIMLGAEKFWALRDISFEVKRGEVLGIIGKNGAGKSTLLKILCRVTSPTEGRALIKGRVGSLLEVGTGFHLELTGRENIYLSGAILGMDKAYIERKIDEIIDFSGIEKFIDTPVKRYSSGMKVRLGFAVAAHLEPEILLIDEVLAVGDAVFQKKCLGKMDNITNEGRTILLISHNMASIKNLCSRALLLENGRIILNGESTLVVNEYLKKSSSWNETDLVYSIKEPMIRATKGNEVEIENLELVSPDGRALTKYGTLEDIVIRINYRANKRILSPAFVIDIKDQLGVRIVHLNNSPISGYPIGSIEGCGKVELHIKKLPLLAGRYLLDICISHEGRAQDKGPVCLPEVIALEIAERNIYHGTASLNSKKGFICVQHKWKHEVRV